MTDCEKHLKETFATSNYKLLRYLAPNNCNGDNRSRFRSEVVLADKRALHRSLARAGLNNFRRNLHAFLLSPFKSQGDEVEQEVPSRSLRTVYSAVSCTTTAYNFLFIAKIISSAFKLSAGSLLLSSAKSSFKLISKDYRSSRIFVTFFPSSFHFYIIKIFAI